MRVIAGTGLCSSLLLILGFSATRAEAQPAPVGGVHPAPAQAGGSLSLSTSSGASASTTARPRSEDAVDPPSTDARGLDAQSTINGGTGLLRTLSADSGGEGTFRLGVIGSYYTGSDFLCPTCSVPSTTPHGTVLPGGDDVTQLGTRFLLSFTPARFLEGYAAIRFQGTSNDKGEPRVMSVLGDTTLGLKAFMPSNPDRIFTFGGAADVTLLNSPGSVSIDSANVGVRALGTADFTRRARQADRIPLRLHLNLGYVFDNSYSIAEDVESNRFKTLGVEQRITRVERFGHDLNRVDHFGTSIAVEGVWAAIHPFIEWSLDVPVNRQSHYCGNNISRSAGDGCLSDSGFSAVPSRLTFGARLYPWAADWLRGASALLAVDVGTGATSTFIEEVTPERPWAIHLGLAWAVDTAAHASEKVVEKVVEVPGAPPPEHHIDGLVVRAGKDEPVPNAIVRYENKSFTGMVTNEEGKFRSTNLDPGEYRLTVTAEGYKDGECTAVIPGIVPTGTGMPAAAPAPVAAAPVAPVAPGAPPAPPPAPVSADGSVKCELEALPRTATITGTLRNGDTTQYIEGGTVTITDPLGRNLALKTDAEGTFRFGNVPAGKSKLTAEADGYLSSATEITLEARKDQSVELSLHERPKAPNVVVTKTELKLKKEIHFLHGSAEILPDSMALLEEAADVLRTHSEIAAIEVQGHTDDTGTAEINMKLSADRANAVRNVLIENGVDAARLTARGYGQEKPLAPNTTPKNKAKNRRVQLIIVP